MFPPTDLHMLCDGSRSSTDGCVQQIFVSVDDTALGELSRNSNGARMNSCSSIEVALLRHLSGTVVVVTVVAWHLEAGSWLWRKARR